ncbi:MAG: hypothetical protein Q9197_000908 [Variospora fuerteventurae]
MPSHLASNKTRNTSSARAQGALSFVPVVECVELRHKETFNVTFVPVKTVMYSQDKASDSMQVVFPDPDLDKLALARSARVEPEEAATTHNLRRRSVGKRNVKFILSVTTGKPAGAEGVVSTEDLLVLNFPDAVFKQEVVIYRPSWTIEICETPIRLRKNKPEIPFRRWAIVLNNVDMRRTKGFMEFLERQFSLMHPDVLSYVNNPRDPRDQTLKRNALTEAAAAFSAGPQHALLPNNAVLHHFPKTFKETLCFTGFLASPEIQKMVKEMGGIFEEEASVDGSMVEEGRQRQNRTQAKKAKKLAAAERAAQQEQERLEGKIRRSAKKNAKAKAKKKAKKAAINPDVECLPADGD